MNEIIFLIEEAAEGGFTARALGESIFTEADTLNAIRQQVRKAVNRHFDDGNAPKVIPLRKLYRNGAVDFIGWLGGAV
jgi:hypothetical protein